MPASKKNAAAESSAKPHLRVGVLALQGDIEEHLAALRALKADAVRVKTPEELKSVDGLIIPGGESTAVANLLEHFKLAKPLMERARYGMPIWGTCMGMIVMAEKIVGWKQPTLGLLHIEVKRNAFGRQIESGEEPVQIEGFDSKPFPGVFIRAPRITRVGGEVEVLASVEGDPVLVRQGPLLAAAFHPELSGDLRLHHLFLERV